MGFGCLPWVRWDYAHRWLPEDVHTSLFAKDAIGYYMEDWAKACTHNERPLAMKHLHHFILAAGLLMRDIDKAYFSLADPDDVDNLPRHVLSTQLGLDFLVQVEGVVAKVEHLFMQSSSPRPAKTHVVKRKDSGSQLKKRLQAAPPAATSGNEAEGAPRLSSKGSLLKKRLEAASPAAKGGNEAEGVPGTSSKKRPADAEATDIDEPGPKEPGRKRMKTARPDESLEKSSGSKVNVGAVESRQSSRLQDKGPRVKYLKNGGMIRPGQ